MGYTNRMETREIHCSACGRDAIVRAEPVYEDFRKVGEAFVCTACGHRYADRESTPFKAAPKRPSLFTDEPEARPSIFSGEDRHHCCLYCKNYVLSAFDQRCGITNRTTEATGCCLRFVSKEESDGETGK